MPNEFGTTPQTSPIEISVVVPVYRSQDCLEALIRCLDDALSNECDGYEVVLVNDCSPDNSWAVIESLCAQYSQVRGVDLRRNFGQDNAILTGLRLARGRFVVVMDDDLQHDPRDIPMLLSKAKEGFDVVYAKFRIKHQRLWKNMGSWFNGKLAEWVISKPPGLYLSPFKIIRREVAQLACVYDGPDPYVDGLLLQVTSRLAEVPVEHHSRYRGQSSYTPLRSLAVWARHAFSFSVLPLRLVTVVGLTFAALGLFTAALVLLYRVFRPEDFPAESAGWASLMLAVLICSGLQMIFLGILGEYAGRMFLKVNRKPQTSIYRVIESSTHQGHQGPPETHLPRSANVSHQPDL